MTGSVVVLAGGTGGAKFVRGLAQCVPPERLTVVANTGDDVTMHGLRVSPDVDILTYTLAGIVDPVKGWGIAGDTFNCIEQLRRYGREGWFNLGDRDLATHILRTLLLSQGAQPSEIADLLRRQLGVPQRVLPMTDEPVETHVHLDDGSVLHFQEYLIQRGAPLNVKSVTYRNVSTARPAAGVLEALAEAEVILLAPSSPVASIGTILSVPGIFDAIRSSDGRCAAVSPLLGDAPISGPSAQLMRALGLDVSNVGLCEAYGELIELLVIHEADAKDVAAIERRGLRALAIDTLMPDPAASRCVAAAVLEALDYAVTQVELPHAASFVAPAPKVGEHYKTRPAAGASEDDLRRRIAALEEEVNGLRQQAEAASEESRVAWTECDLLAETIEDMEQRLAAAHADVTVATEDVEVAWGEHDALTEQLRALERRLQEMEARAQSVERDLERDLHDLEDEAEAHATARDEAERTLQALQRELAERERAAEESQRHREQAQRGVVALRARLTEAEQALAKERTRAEALEARLTSAQAERRAAVKRIEELEQQLRATAAQVTALQTALDVSASRIANVESTVLGGDPATAGRSAPATPKVPDEGEPEMQFELPAESLSWKPAPPQGKAESMAEKARRKGRAGNPG